MGCGTLGANHLEKNGHPLCGKDQLGYMWDRETFDKMVSEKRACLACIKELEKMKLMAALDCFYNAWAAGSNSVETTAIETAKQHAGNPERVYQITKQHSPKRGSHEQKTD